MIYFLHDAQADRIKIGTTIRLTERLAAHKRKHGWNAVVLGVMRGSYADEATIHQRFAHLSLGAEMFRDDEELMEFIRLETVPWDGQDEAPRMVGVRLPKELARKLKVVAKCQGRSMAEVFEENIRGPLTARYEAVIAKRAKKKAE